MLKVGIVDSEHEEISTTDMEGYDVIVAITNNMEMFLVKGEHCGAIGRQIQPVEFITLMKDRAVSLRLQEENIVPSTLTYTGSAPDVITNVRDGDRL